MTLPPLGDGECTFWPDAWAGVSLTECCLAHDASSLDPAAHLDLGLCVLAAMAPVDPLLGAAVAGLMTLGTALWCLARYGPRGRPPRR